MTAPQTTTTRDEAVPFPAYGELPFAELGSAVKAAQYGAPEPYPFDPEFFPGHQVFGPINFNSLNRIVTWFVKRALASAPAPASGGVDAKTLRGIIARWETRREYLNTNPSAYDAFIAREIAGVSEPPLARRLSLSPAATPGSEAEPVAWQVQFDDGNWSKAIYSEDEIKGFRQTIITDKRLLYALAKPASSPAGGDVREALREIAEQDVTGIAFDPDWPRRIARAALSQSTSAGRVGE